MSNILALKYRPRTWGDIAGQDLNTRILQESIIKDDIKGAYLFSGATGTGKTSLVRVFAKALLCESDRSDGKPCLVCKSCSAAEKGNHSFIAEIDAATESKVDSIRELLASLETSFTEFRTIVILDECHQLSNSASNALLKTLEEPFKKSIFCLCTTRPDKLPKTLLTRCFQLEFRFLSSKHIFERLQYIAKREEIPSDDDGLFLIADSSGGSMRNAIMVLDQGAILGEKLTYEFVSDLIGRLNVDDGVELFEHCLAKDAKGILRWNKRFIHKHCGDKASMLLRCVDFLAAMKMGGLSNIQGKESKAKNIASRIDYSVMVRLIEKIKEYLKESFLTSILDEEMRFNILLFDVYYLIGFGMNIQPGSVEVMATKNYDKIEGSSLEDSSLYRNMTDQISTLRKYFSGTVLQIENEKGS